jgi:hypothetical protein
MAVVETDLKYALSRVAFARERLGIELDDWQEQFLKSNAKQILLNCARQSGKSTMSSVAGLQRALYFPGSTVLIIAPALRQAKITFNKVAGFYDQLGKAAVPALSRTQLSMDLANGSFIEAIPADDKTIRGYSVNLLIIDEASRVPDVVYESVRPMLAVTKGRLLVLSTPWGKRGFFYEAWTGEPDWERYEVPGYRCPRMSPEFLAAEKRRKPLVYSQEYDCIFTDTEDQVITTDMIEAAKSDKVEPIYPGGRLIPSNRGRG